MHPDGRGIAPPDINGESPSPQNNQIDLVGAGLCSAHTGAPNIPRRARERSAQSKTAENLPIPRSPHIADFAPLSKTPGAG